MRTIPIIAMSKTDATSVCGSITQTTKMPCKSYSLPTVACITGFRMAQIPGSICSDCYANKGNYKLYAAGVEPAQHARLVALLNGDAEYQRLKAETKRLAERKEALNRGLYSHRIDVGTVSNGPLSFFHIKFSGDNWQEVVDKAAAARK